MESIERDVIKNSEYIVIYYNRNGSDVTNLELQKLAYFLEAIYMVCTGEKYLYKEEFSAWNLGPVNTEIYNRYRNFGRLPIKLDNIVDINPINLEYIEILYDLFKDFTATQLVNLSHAAGSPWYNVYKRHDGKIPHYETISKIETKEWFANLVDVKKENEK